MAAASEAQPGALGQQPAKMTMLKVDLDLVKKYNVPGPRYTSYPPATHFTDQVALDDLMARMRVNAGSDRDLSLYLHLPFCWSLCWFCGCTTVITTEQKASGQYIDYIKKELNLARRSL